MAEVPSGLTTSIALSRLHEHLFQALQHHLNQNRWQVYRNVVHEAWSYRSQLSVFRWPAALSLILVAVALITSGLYAGEQIRFSGLVVSGVLLLLVCVLNLALVLREAHLRQCEMPDLVKRLLDTLKDQIPMTSWGPEHYPHQHCPLSPCISLQWTVRDGTIVNLPVSLLVLGDTIMLRPGQKIPADCVPLGQVESGKLYAGSTYSPPVEGIGGEALTSPKVRLPNLPQPYVIMETPFVGLLRTVLQEALERPVSVYQKQRNVMAWGMEMVLIPTLALVCMGLCIVRFHYGFWCSTGFAGSTWNQDLVLEYELTNIQNNAQYFEDSRPHINTSNIVVNNNNTYIIKTSTRHDDVIVHLPNSANLPQYQNASLKTSRTTVSNIIDADNVVKSETILSINNGSGDINPLLADILETVLVVPACVVLPLLPLVLPLVWTALNTIAAAILLTLHSTSRAAVPPERMEARGARGATRRMMDTNSHQKKHGSDGSSRASQDLDGADSARLCPPEQSSSTEDGSAASDLPKLDAVSWTAVWHHTVLLIRGDVTSCVRGSSILHVLASVTNLCCVDKKGVLSWANPTAEKVFFLRNRAPGAFPGASQPDKSRSNLRSSDISLATDDDVFPNQDHSVGGFIPPPPPPPPPPNPNNRTGIYSSSNNNRTNPLLTSHAPNHQHSSRGGGIGGPQSPVESEPVLLSLTHRNDTPFRLSFDEPEWKNCLGSLKPLGLSVLLNTCHPDTQAHYTTFCGHLTNEASYTQDLVPVSQRRCLCELSEQIGFSRAAQQPFRLEHQLSVFRHVPAELACKDRLARSLMVSKLKFPFPHMMSVLMRDKATHKLELLTQGTADIVLDSCSDYWDGTDLSPLTEKDRKKLLDFYHRTSLSAYCTAFSYRPSPCVVHADLTKLYMELPTDPSHLYTRSPTPHNSTEALFGDRAHSEYEEVEDIDDLFRMQCKQIFIGMVTMQYQAKKDMVQLIEQLESACVRFVHFSKENELRSRVFSEKMGLESGWNCHISLLDDKAKGEESVSSGSRAGHHSGASLHRTSAEDVMSMGASSRIKNSSFRSKSLKRKLIRGRSLLESSKVLSHSAPSAINLEAPLVKFDDDVSIYSSSSSSNTSSAFGQHHFHYEGSGSELSHHPYPPFHLGAGDDHPRSSPHSPHHPIHQSPIHSLHSYSPHHHHYQHHRLPHHHESHQGHSHQHIGGPTSSPYHPCSTSHSPLVYSSHSPRSQHSARLSSSPAAVLDGGLTHSHQSHPNPLLHHPASPNLANINDSSCQSPSTGGSDFGTAPCCLKHNEDEGDRLDTLTEATVTTTLDAAVTNDKFSCCGDEEDGNQSRLVGCRRDVIDGFKNPHHNNGCNVEVGIHEDASDVGRRRQLGIRRSGSADGGEHGYLGGLREGGAGLEPLVLEGQHSREASHGTSSSDRSTCFNFDMSNRARLPKGINNIRPHLRDVDNVPLLVSLFTDCTAAATRQMLEIMNENKEVVLLTGSSANVDNVSLFVSADASVGVEPLYPVVCMRVPVMTPPPDGMPSPTGLATRLHTLPCALLFNRHGPLSLVRLIEKSRHLLQCTSNSLQFWAGCSCSLAFLQLLALFALLPPVLHTGDVLWFALVCLPLLSLSLQASPHNPEVMSQATGKNKLVPNSQLLRFVAAHYGSKFLPSLLVVICCAALALRGMCNNQVTTPAAMFGDRAIFNDTVEASSSRNYDNHRRAALGSDAFRMPIIASGGAMDEFNVSSPDELNLDADKHSTLFFSSQDEKIPLVATPTKERVMFGPKASLSSNTTAFGGGNPLLTEVFLKPPPHHDAPVATLSVAKCFYVYQKRNVTGVVPHILWTGWGPHYAESVRAVQVFTAFLVLLYFCIISISFVHRMGQVWKKNPFVNRVWAVTVPSLLLLQLVYSSLVCSYSAPQGVSSIPLVAWLVALTWGLLLLPVNELLKRREIRANKRYLKKARLEFGTKLGMNSPF